MTLNINYLTYLKISILRILSVTFESRGQTDSWYPHHVSFVLDARKELGCLLQVSQFVLYSINARDTARTKLYVSCVFSMVDAIPVKQSNCLQILLFHLSVSPSSGVLQTYGYKVTLNILFYTYRKDLRYLFLESLFVAF